MRKRVIITGGDRGIGLAIALKLDRSGEWDVMTTGRRSPTGPTKYHVDAPMDLGHNFLGQGRFTGYLKKIGWWGEPIHGLVNNAGVAIAKKFEDHTLNDFREMFEINCVAAVFTMQSLLEEMEMGKASIVNISSISGLTGFSTMSGYCASKFALNGLMQVAAKELSKKGIRVNNVCPGPTDTDMWKALDAQYKKINGWETDEQSEQAYMSKLLIKRIGHPNDTADAVEFLLSDASQYITGINLKVCGGNMIG